LTYAEGRWHKVVLSLLLVANGFLCMSSVEEINFQRYLRRLVLPVAVEPEQNTLIGSLSHPAVCPPWRSFLGLICSSAICRALSDQLTSERAFIYNSSSNPQCRFVARLVAHRNRNHVFIAVFPEEEIRVADKW
jgi:hypothetical protein